MNQNTSRAGRREVLSADVAADLIEGAATAAPCAHVGPPLHGPVVSTEPRPDGLPGFIATMHDGTRWAVHVEEADPRVEEAGEACDAKEDAGNA